MRINRVSDDCFISVTYILCEVRALLILIHEGLAQARLLELSEEEEDLGQAVVSVTEGVELLRLPQRIYKTRAEDF